LPTPRLPELLLRQVPRWRRQALPRHPSLPRDKNDSVTMNIWLHKEVIKKITEIGGKVPQELLR
jgi:hypothetical protein